MMYTHTYVLQEPYRWPSVAAISRKYLSIRYSILPYYYTLFFRAHADSRNYLFYPVIGTVLQPLFVAFPSDKESRAIDTQFLVGEALLISPQLKLGQSVCIDTKYWRYLLPYYVHYLLRSCIHECVVVYI